MTCAETLCAHGDRLFAEKQPVLSRWQEIAELLYPERADFTTARNVGDDISTGIMSSYPVLARRDLGDAFSSMLRPTAKKWFHLRTEDQTKESTEDKQWLQWLEGFMFNIMSSRDSLFARATTQADHDFVTFGQACLSIEYDRLKNNILYRCWHLRDVAWREDYQGVLTNFHRNWTPSAIDVVKLFPKNVHPSLQEKARKNPYQTVNVRHVVMPRDEYCAMDGVGSEPPRTPFVSCFIDNDHKSMLEVSGSWTPHYLVPRWSVSSGQAYAHSPATSTSLPDVRMLQDVMRVLFESGEKAVDPPLLGVREALRSDLAVYPGGVTWVDAAYDERLGEVLRPMTVDSRALPFGMEMAQIIQAQIKEAFYLSKISLPPAEGRDMTAYEVAQRVQEYIRHALPLFSPVESEYNAPLCEMTMELILRHAPEALASMPKSLHARRFDFAFESPLHEAIERVKVGQYMEAHQILAQAVPMDPNTAFIIDEKKAARDVLTAVVPAVWMRSTGVVEEMSQKRQQEMQQQQLLQQMQQGADVAKTVKEATPTAGLGGVTGGML